MSFDDKTVWITGASSGIGAALARDWAGRGARLILSGRDEARLGEVAQSLDTETLVLPFDVRDEAAMQRASEEAVAWHGVDIFVANAGISQRSPAVDTDFKVYRDIVEIDLLAQIAATQALLPHLVERGSGKLVFISSIAGKVGVPLRTAYCAAKFGLIGYADALRAELSQSGVVIDNGIAPDEAARRIIDAVAANQREIIVAEGMEEAMGELRRTPDQLLDQVAAMVAKGYMEKMQGE